MEPPQGQGSQTTGCLNFPKSVRLAKRPQFLACYTHGKRFASRCFLVYALPADSQGRLGIAVSKKIGPAAQRNRLKRLIREFYRRNRTALIGLDIVVIPKRGVDITAFKQAGIDRELAGLASRIRSSFPVGNAHA